MSVEAAIETPVEKTAGTATTSPAQGPVVRPKTSGWQLFKDVLNHG